MPLNVVGQTIPMKLNFYKNRCQANHALYGRGNDNTTRTQCNCEWYVDAKGNLPICKASMMSYILYYIHIYLWVSFGKNRAYRYSVNSNI